MSSGGDCKSLTAANEGTSCSISIALFVAYLSDVIDRGRQVVPFCRDCLKTLAN
jgi:hypothetical protein